jgi:hypothetical protein
MRVFFALLLRRLGLLQFDLIAVFRANHPDAAGVKDHELVVVGTRDVTKWACLRCPGGCGNLISLSLNPQRRPRWHVLTDYWTRPSVSPSVHQTNDCGCHFWIRRGKVEWCPGGRRRVCRQDEGATSVLALQPSEPPAI